MAHGGRARGEMRAESSVEGGGMEGGVGRARGEMGGGTREQCGSNKGAVGPLKTKLVTRVGGWGEAWGGGPWRAGKGGDGGGGTREQWGGDGGRRGEVAHGGRARGWGFLASLKPKNWSDLGATKVHWFTFLGSFKT